uniref:Adhesion G protein-coupled receptor L3 n=1 Tax=Mus musculus TaxID=10090 RepID=D6RFB0_MOUSE
MWPPQLLILTMLLAPVVHDAITEPSVQWWQVLMYFQTHVREHINTLKCSMNVSLIKWNKKFFFVLDC